MLTSIGLLTLAAVLTGWVANDAWARERRWIRWSLATALFGVFAAVPWLVSRRRSPVVRRRTGRQTLAIYAAALCFTLMFRSTVVVFKTFAYRVARVEGLAMAPTLESQDRLVVENWRYLSERPKRGDIVMMRYPLSPEKFFVKRVIAAEGDEIRIVDGQTMVNLVPVDDWYVAAANRSREDWGPEIVPEGYYFVMGDNRSNSSDSRHWMWVPAKYITGRVCLRWFPFSSITTF